MDRGPDAPYIGWEEAQTFVGVFENRLHIHHSGDKKVLRVNSDGMYIIYSERHNKVDKQRAFKG